MSLSFPTARRWLIVAMAATLGLGWLLLSAQRATAAPPTPAPALPSTCPQPSGPLNGPYLVVCQPQFSNDHLSGMIYVAPKATMTLAGINFTAKPTKVCFKGPDGTVANCLDVPDSAIATPASFTVPVTVPDLSVEDVRVVARFADGKTPPVTSTNVVHIRKPTLVLSTKNPCDASSLTLDPQAPMLFLCGSGWIPTGVVTVTAKRDDVPVIFTDMGSPIPTNATGASTITADDQGAFVVQVASPDGGHVDGTYQIAASDDHADQNSIQIGNQQIVVLPAATGVATPAPTSPSGSSTGAAGNPTGSSGGSTTITCKVRCSGVAHSGLGWQVAAMALGLVSLGLLLLSSGGASSPGTPRPSASSFATSGQWQSPRVVQRPPPAQRQPPGVAPRPSSSDAPPPSSL